MTGVSKRWLYVLAIVALAVAVRAYNLAANGLWYDELQSVTHAILPMPDLIRSVGAHDPHPPLYYIQLHVWMQLGQSDVWIRLNSVLLSVLTLISIYATTRRVFRERAALLTSLFFAIAPYAVYDGQEARMYTWLMLLAVWCWYFNHQFLLTRSSSPLALGIVATSIAVLYSHGTTFLLLPAIYAYAVLSVVTTRIDRSTLVKWAVLQVSIVLALLPWLFYAYTIRGDAGHLAVPTLTSVSENLWTLVFGHTPAPILWFQILAVLLVLALLVLGNIKDNLSFSFVLSLIFAPILVAAVTSYAISPVWYHRTFAFVTPFICIGLALALTPTP
ncbi:MAG: glycosyltransferase family 39 protein, partial [Gemmatimonadota bacterium]